ncbi:MAG: aminotransferase class III-fold pyridoxal phosphate-dependent enzyme [Myxococcales bacterium]|nr:aminotransferase class III-fold pyridoxal phosphate-dependent enzyme [Myxococcales bacterium]
MAKKRPSPLDSLLDSPRVREAATALVDAVAQEAAGRELRPEQYTKALRQLERSRGRPLLLPLLLGGNGRGARIRLADGTHRIDFVGGIGQYLFGHSDHDLLETAAAAAAVDTVFQGHLAPGPEYLALSQALLRHAGKRLRHVWLSVSGSMANENALKMIFQQHAPADHLVVFDRSFAGRTTTLAEITDKPGFREGLPLRGNVLHVPFYDDSVDDPIGRSVRALDAHLQRYPGRIAGMLFELVQGEGGFHTAPREFFAALMERCHESGLAVWVDEVQTFGRTGELFAFRTLELDEYPDVVTAGKALQGSAVLFTRRYNPKPGLVAGTFAGATAAMAVGVRIIERLDSEGYLGPEGRVSVLARRVERRFESLEKRMPNAVGRRSGLGAMQAFVPWEGDAEVALDVVKTAFDEGLVLLGAGRDPAKIRMLLPVNVTDEELEAGFAILEKALRIVSEARELPC